MEVKGLTGKTLRRECSRSRGVDSCKRRVDIIDFQGVLLAITTPFFVYSKKNLKTENSVTVLQSSVMFAQSYILSIAKSKKQIFSLSSKRDIARSKFELNSPFEDTYHLFCKIQPFPLPLVT